ncbi:hypothetical protein AHAS_Ahas13G0295400 [Arachis hypogaea]
MGRPRHPTALRPHQWKPDSTLHAKFTVRQLDKSSNNTIDHTHPIAQGATVPEPAPGSLLRTVIKPGNPKISNFQYPNPTFEF